MNYSNSHFTRTISLMAFLIFALGFQFSLEAQTRVTKSKQNLKATRLKAQPVKSNTWYFEGLKMSPADEKAFVSLLSQIDQRAYNVKEVARGRTLKTYGKSDPAQVQLVKKTIVQQGATQKKGGIFRHKVHTEDKFSESTIIWVSAAGIDTDVLNKINRLMIKYQGDNVVNVEKVKANRMSIRQK
jgi:hypothetical protein